MKMVNLYILRRKLLTQKTIDIQGVIYVVLRKEISCRNRNVSFIKSQHLQSMQPVKTGYAVFSLISLRRGKSSILCVTRPPCFNSLA